MLDSQQSVSRPASLLSTILPATASSGACLRRQFVGPFTSIRVELDIRVDAFGTNPYDFVTLTKRDGPEVGLQITRLG